MTGNRPSTTSETVTEAVEMLQEMASRFAGVIPAVDATAMHDRWDAGIGPFEEDKQVEMILNELAEEGHRLDHIETEVPYPRSGKRCDLVLEGTDHRMPVEVKLLRFRRDNGNIDPNMYKSVFSPFPERSSSSLLTDARKLAESSFELPAGLLGLYYEEDDEEYDQLRAGMITEKFEIDIEYWYDQDIETVAAERFEGLRHPHHQHGAVIAWVLSR